MDELKKAWDELKENESKDIQFDVNQLRDSIRSKSIGVIETLNKKLKWKTWFVWGGMLLFILIIYLETNPVTDILLYIIIAVYLVSGLILMKERKVIKDELDLSKNLKSTLENYYFKVKRILRYEELIGLTLYPISASAGFIIGLNFEHDNSDFFDTWKGWAVWATVIVILTPLCHWFAKWMNKYAFGKYLNQLAEDINELNKKGE
ncbi:hypothetical protein [Fulvivirga lutea]|uniref:Uncharacterized protein n=1 Tax=Fulvivirga lutea TaxID=2810512 RepID=A0A974WHI4_9BACT|nr:hypothetical protein [Fulvivirga lutea]QSE97342.1 hypothetical protein JR347_17430 [Fulvivirga lutea]